MSSSTTPSVPTPAAARYISTGAPSPPAPITSTEARLQRRLAGAADLAQHDMAGVAFEFVGGQHCVISHRSAISHARVPDAVQHSSGRRAGNAVR